MKTLVFPDQTEISIHQTMSILDKQGDQTLVAYLDAEAAAQVLWVPNDFIVNK